MLLCNLSVLLSERNLKITQVSKDTGISRTTLTSLSQNKGAGIQFDTINKLCTYLKITPKDLFIFYPAELDFKIINLDIIGVYNFAIDLILYFYTSNSTFQFKCPISINGTVETRPEINSHSIDREYIGNIVFSLDANWGFDNCSYSDVKKTLKEEYYYASKKINSIWCDIPIQLKNEFESKLNKKISMILQTKYYDYLRHYFYVIDATYSVFGSFIPNSKPYNEELERSSRTLFQDLKNKKK